MDRKEQIKKLQIVNNRKLVQKKLSLYLKEIELNSFLSLDETKELQMKIFTLMDELDEKKKSTIFPLDISIKKILEEKKYIFLKEDNCKTIFFHRQSIKIGAIEIKNSDIANNIDFIIEESEFGAQGCSFFLVDRCMKYGLCLWREEYKIKVYSWDMEK